MSKKIVAIIQARIGSTRLPGKVLREIMGRPMLSFMLERLSFCDLIDEIVIATTTSERDKPIVEFCLKNNISYYRGSENDVLDRFYNTAVESGANIILRLTADCPLIDPRIIDKIISQFTKNSNLDYMNTAPTYPEGVDAEIFTFFALEKAWNNAKLNTEREHVTAHIWSNPKEFNFTSLQYSRDLSKYRFTVDEPEDFEVVKSIFVALYKEKGIFHLENIIDYLDSHPDVFKLNQNIKRNEGLYKSIEKEPQANLILDEYKKTHKD